MGREREGGCVCGGEGMGCGGEGRGGEREFLYFLHETFDGLMF